MSASGNGPRPTRAKRWIFGTVFTISAALAICPPLYLAVARRDPVILGFPFAVAYMLFVGLLVTVAIMSLYQYEQARGEVD